jgi:putative endopeptidase
MTVGENTADIAGIAVAYDALKWQNKDRYYKKLAVIHQTNVSIFLARIWKVKWRRNFFVCGLTTPFTTYLAC